MNNIEITTSQLASAILNLRGKPFSLRGYEPFIPVYDLDPEAMTVKCSRQVGKSVSVGALITTKSIARPYFNSIYIAPLSNQSSRFNSLYLQPFFNSPLVRKHYMDAGSKKNVFEKGLSNGSLVFLSYAQTEQDADRIRGIAADSVNFDEMADIALEAIPIIKETLSASDYGFIRGFGTPKSEMNTLEIMFKRGNGLEWCVKCDHCGKWNIPWDHETCINMCKGTTGPVCNYCAQPVDMLTGKWVAARPDIKDHYSFHMPRFILSSRHDPRKWADLKKSIQTYPASKLDNEVFGLAAGIAGRILSQREAMSCCDSSKTSFDSSWVIDSRGINNVVLGVDWSVTGGVASFTVITILGYDYMGKCYVLYSEKLQGIDILDQVKRVETLARQFGVQMIGTDRGVGQLQYELLKQSFGGHRVIPVQYCAAKNLLRYDRQGGFLSADRTQCMDMVFLKMKLGSDKFVTPSWELMSPFWADALSIFEEESLAGRRLFRKDEGSTDDWFHSVVFGHIAWFCLTGQYNYFDEVPYEEMTEDMLNQRR